MAQEPITSAEPSDSVLKRRKQLLSLGLDSKLAAQGSALDPSSPGSAAMIENVARREDTALDIMFGEYEGSLPDFTAFIDSNTAKHFFTAAEPALRVSRAQ